MTTKKTFFDAKLGLAKKAWGSADFKKALKTNPKQALSKEWGHNLKDDIVVKLYENTKTLTHLVIPTKSLISELKAPKGKNLRSVTIGLIKKILKDPELMAKYISNPRPFLEKELGTKFPPSLKFKVVQDTSNLINLVLPTKPQSVSKNGALSDEDLENIAGGGGLEGIIGTAFTLTTSPLSILF